MKERDKIIKQKEKEEKEKLLKEQEASKSQVSKDIDAILNLKMSNEHDADNGRE